MKASRKFLACSHGDVNLEEYPLLNFVFCEFFEGLLFELADFGV